MNLCRKTLLSIKFTGIMFGNLFGASSRPNGTDGRSPSPTCIREANSQMQCMHSRIVELEQRIREQSELLTRREREYVAGMQRLERQKDGAIREVQNELMRQQERCATLENLLRERDVSVAYLLHRY